LPTTSSASSAAKKLDNPLNRRGAGDSALQIRCDNVLTPYVKANGMVVFDPGALRALGQAVVPGLRPAGSAAPEQGLHRKYLTPKADRIVAQVIRLPPWTAGLLSHMTKNSFHPEPKPPKEAAVVAGLFSCLPADTT